MDAVTAAQLRSLVELLGNRLAGPDGRGGLEVVADALSWGKFVHGAGVGVGIQRLADSVENLAVAVGKVAMAIESK